MDLGQPLDVGDAVPARHEQAQGLAVVNRQRLAVHLPGEQVRRTHRVFDRHAAGISLLDFAPANLLHADIGAEENDFLGAFAHAGFIEQGGQGTAAPVGVADEAVEQAGAVAAAFKTRLQVNRAAAHQLGQGQFEFPLHHAGYAQKVAVVVNLGLAVMLDDVEVLVGGDVGSDLPGVLIMGGAGAFSPHLERLGHIGEGHEALALGECRQRPAGQGRRAGGEHPGTLEHPPAAVVPNVFWLHGFALSVREGRGRTISQDSSAARFAVLHGASVRRRWRGDVFGGRARQDVEPEAYMDVFTASAKHIPSPAATHSCVWGRSCHSALSGITLGSSL